MVLIHIIDKLKVVLFVFAMMVYVSGIKEQFNSDIDQIHNKNQYIYQKTYSYQRY